MPNLNLAVAWVWTVLGVISGLFLGSHFHKSDWQGGYASFRRRLYRLGHISFFGLGLLNFMFYITTSALPMPASWLQFAGWLFLAGAITMPACCFMVAHRPHWRLWFGVPTISLLGACFIMAWFTGGGLW